MLSEGVECLPLFPWKLSCVLRGGLGYRAVNVGADSLYIGLHGSIPVLMRNLSVFLAKRPGSVEGKSRKSLSVVSGGTTLWGPK